jgi:voltage-gated potassium channel
VGRQIAEELRREGRSVVVIDSDPVALAEAARADLKVVAGNAAEDATLLEAGIERAAGLIAAVGADVDNLFVTLSARALRADLPIVARANHDDAIPKLRRAGATQVVSPYATAGRQMARLVLRPATVDFIETLMRGANAELLLEDVRVADGSPLVGLTIAEARQRLPNTLLLAVQRAGEMITPPASELTLQAGDVIAAVGREEELRQLERASEEPPA